MNSKILKTELFTLFLLSVLSFYSFYYGESLPDNYFSISSREVEFSYLNYYLTSCITLVGYYSGPWLLFPFLIFAFFYTFIYSKRDCLFDGFNFFSLTSAFFLTTYLFFPNFLGEGAEYILKDLGSKVTYFLLTLFFWCAFFAGTFRDSFKYSMISCIEYLKERPAVTYNAIKKYFLNRKIKNARFPKPSVKSKLALILRGKEGKVSSSIKDAGEEKPLDFKKNDPDDASEGVLEKEAQPDLDFETTPVNEPLRRRNTTTGGLMKLNKQGSTQEKEYYDIVKNLKVQKHVSRTPHPDDGYFDEIIQLIEEKLGEFKIEGRIINVLKGPVVDTFELELGPGVKVSKVTGSQEDLSLALYGAPIRVVYPMKGRTTVGIEVPRNPREIIYLDEVLNSSEFQSSKYNLPVAMGKNAFGDTFVVDLAAMPHMLVAGATGAGKSVFINALLVSLLLKKSPRQMKLILIDPKQLELALYSNLPHLVMPVLTDAKTASIALLWAVQEMERRYSILKDFGVRNIAGFNEKLKSAGPEMIAKIHGYYEDYGAEEYELPYLVIIVDEFADLILTKAGKEIESNISRLAAKARAAGVHIVLATQRPSVDVITGVIKSNFPTRVSFRVTSQTDSRTILDKMGAEKLLGKGDMLYKHGIETLRVHSSYVDEQEIEALTDKLGVTDSAFNQNAVSFLENGGELETDEYTYGSHISPVNDAKSNDVMYGEAVKIVCESRAASASMLQRRMKIGYNRAANLIDELEAKGVVGPPQGSKPRQVLGAEERI